MRMRMPSRRDAVAPTIERILDAVREGRPDAGAAGRPRRRRRGGPLERRVHGNKLAPRRVVRVTVEVPASRGAR